MDIIIVAILVLVLGAAAGYVIKAKKRGVKCIGCPEGCNCGKNAACNGAGCAGCSGCGDAK